LTEVVQIKVPDFLSERDLKVAAAIEAFSKGTLSVGKASEIAEMPLQEFPVELKKGTSTPTPTQAKKLLRSLSFPNSQLQISAESCFA
jgi:hypothetical protein